MFAFRLVGQAFRRVVALLLFAVIRGRRALVPLAGLLLVGYAALPILAGTAATRPPDQAGGPSTAARGVATTLVAGSSAAVPSVDSYIKGLTQFDAGPMWGSLSDEALQAMQSRGGSLEALQKGLDDAKQSGARYESVTKIGQYPLQDGQTYLFYVLARRGFAGPDQVDQVYFVFTVDQNGKIANIV
jgi:hypothetical protein